MRFFKTFAEPRIFENENEMYIFGTTPQNLKNVETLAIFENTRLIAILQNFCISMKGFSKRVYFMKLFNATHIGCT